jgi:hypothetical protein
MYNPSSSFCPSKIPFSFRRHFGNYGYSNRLRPIPRARTPLRQSFFFGHGAPDSFRSFYRLCPHLLSCRSFSGAAPQSTGSHSWAVFTGWILLLIAQTALVSAHRVDIHRRLGLVGFGLACTMPILAIYAAVDALVRHASRPSARAFFVVPTFDILAFIPLIFFAWKYRSNAAAHKRLIIIATIAILDAAVARWPIHASWWDIHQVEWATEAFLIPLFAYDLFSIRKIHRATLWGSVLLVFLQHVRGPIGQSGAWQAFAAWVQHAAR